MNAWKSIVFALGLLTALPLVSEGATKKSASPCRNSSGGTWAFGQAPQGCAPAGDADTLRNRYPQLVFNERIPNDRSRYVTALNAFFREAADYYLDQRRRQPSDEERANWRRAVLALAHQESYWSQYREARDGKLRVMRGDSRFGHGILQIDERWHPDLAMSERGDDLTVNLLYGLDIYFQGWERAAKASCVRRGNFEDRARAAYSAYNGGPGRICRWQKNWDLWGRNDRGFYSKWQNQEWVRYVSNPTLRSSVNISCLAEGRVGCDDVIAPRSRSRAKLEARDDATTVRSAPTPAALAPRSSRTRSKFVS